MGDSPRARSRGQRRRGRGPGVPQVLDAASLSLGFSCLENGEKAAHLMALLRCELLAERGAHHTPEPSPGSPAPLAPALGPRSLRTPCVYGCGDAQSCQVCPCVFLIFQGHPAAPSTRMSSLPRPDLPRVCSHVSSTAGPKTGVRAPQQRHRSPPGFPIPGPHELLGSGILKFSVSSACGLAPRRHLEVFLFRDRPVEPSGARLKPRDTGYPPYRALQMLGWEQNSRCWRRGGEARTTSLTPHNLLTTRTGQGDRFATRWRLGG